MTKAADTMATDQPNQPINHNYSGYSSGASAVVEGIAVGTALAIPFELFIRWSIRKDRAERREEE